MKRIDAEHQFKIAAMCEERENYATEKDALNRANSINLMRIADALERIADHTEGLRNWAEYNWDLKR